MEKVVANVKRIQMTENETFSSVMIVLNKEFAGITAKRDDNGKIIADEFVEAQIDYINFPPSVLTAVLCDKNEDVALLRSISENRFRQAEFGAILTGATLTIQREHHAAGETFTQNGEEVVAERDLFTTEITKVELSDRAKVLVNRMIDAKLGL